MGLLVSRLSGYSNVVMMNTDAHIHFRDTLQEQWTTAQAAGMLQTLQAGAMASGGNAVTGGGTPGWAFGWYNFSQMLCNIGYFMVPLAIIVAVIIYFIKASELAMASAVFAGVFFLVTIILFKTRRTVTGAVSGVNILIATGVGMVAAGIVGFLVYDPDADDEPQQYQVPQYSYNDSNNQNDNAWADAW